MRAALFGCILALLAASGAMAQTLGGPLDQGTVQSPVLVIEFDRVYADSAFGQRMLAEFEAEGAAIAAENRQIEAELTEEERTLTERRKVMVAEEFRALADAFDDKVGQLRQQQDAKARALNQRSEAARRAFLAAARPVLLQLMRDSGAAVILESRTVFVAAEAIDVTDDATRLIDATIGDGSTLPMPEGDGEEAPAQP